MIFTVATICRGVTRANGGRVATVTDSSSSFSASTRSWSITAPPPPGPGGPPATGGGGGRAPPLPTSARRPPPLGAHPRHPRLAGKVIAPSGERRGHLDAGSCQRLGHRLSGLIFVDIVGIETRR